MPGRQMAVAAITSATEMPRAIAAVFIGRVVNQQSQIENPQSVMFTYTHLHSLRISTPVMA
jgi:hypothetical protein